MKTVTLKTDMRPWRAGDDVHLPDHVADKLVKDGEAENPRPFSTGYETRAMEPEKGGNTYKTKGQRK
jgi:hypothetical protein